MPVAAGPHSISIQNQVRSTIIITTPPKQPMDEKMKSAKLFLDDSSVDSHEGYLRVDAELFWTHLNILKSLGFYINVERSQIKEWYNIENLTWKVEDNHVSNRNRKGRPQMTLLNEAIGAGMWAYWSARGLLTGGRVDEFNVAEYIENAKYLKVDLVPLLKTAIENPFAIFQAVSIEFFELYLRILKLFDEHLDDPVKILRGYQLEVANLKYHAFYFSSDWLNGCLNVYCYCGSESNIEDLKASSECLRILKNSNDMMEFLEKLGVNELLSSDSIQRVRHG
jgi:hypothetical protein